MKPRLGHRVRVLYSVGGVANAVRMALFGLFTLYFYISVMKLPGTLVGIASAVGLIWDAVIDPYIGYLSDRTRFWLGRRHTLMLLGAVTMGPSFWAFFAPPQGMSTGALFLWLLATGLLVRTTSSLYSVPFLALGAELSQDYHGRSLVAGMRGAFALLGTLAASVLPFALFFASPVAGVDPKLDYGAYRAMGLVFGLVMTAMGLIATLGTLPWRSYPHQPEDESTLGMVQGFLDGFAASFRMPSFRVVLISSSLFFLSVAISSVLTMHFLTYYLGITRSDALSALQLSLHVGTFIGVLCWMSVANRVQKHWLYFTATLATAAVMSSVFFLFGEGHPLEAAGPWILRGGYGAVGFFASILRIVPPSMLADVADEDELLTGQRREGVFFGIFTFGEQLAVGVSLLTTGVLVDQFAGLIPGQVQQSPLTGHRIAVLYGLLPAALLVLAAFLILRYPLDRQAVEVIQVGLARQRGARHG